MNAEAAHLRIERSGGFAGVTVTTDVSDPAVIARLLSALPIAGTATGAPDRFVYRFEIDRGEAGARPEVLEVGEHALSSDTRRLIGDLLRARG